MADVQNGAALAAKVVATMKAIGHVEKGGTNTHFNFKFQKWDDVLVAVNKACAETGLAILPSSDLISQNGKKALVRMTIRLLDSESGEHHDSTWIGEGDDAQDKGIQKAITSAYKYFLLKTFQIGVTGEGDPDDEPRAQSRGRGVNAGHPVPPTPPDAREQEAQDQHRAGMDNPGPPVNAFGLEPPKWPSQKAFGEEATNDQKAKAGATGTERGLSGDEASKVRRAVAAELGLTLEERDSKAGYMLWIDFLARSTPDQMDLAAGRGVGLPL